MEKIFYSALIFLISLFVGSLGGAREIVLAPGESIELPAQKLKSITLGDGKILKIRDLGNRIEVFAKKMGDTLLSVGNKRHRVIAVSLPEKILYEKLKIHLKDKLGLKASWSSDLKIQIEGTLYRANDWIKITEIFRNQPVLFRFLGKISPDAVEKTKNWLLPIISDLGLSEDTLKLKPLPHISLDKSYLKSIKKISTQLARLGIEVQISEQQLSQKPSVMVELVLAEIDETFESELGILWGSGPSTGSYKSVVLPQFKPGVLEAQLSALEASGKGQVLARPSLLSRSGEKAEFHAGGEIPIRISGWGSQSVDWKKYGILLYFTPLADNSGRMNLSIETEISIPNLNQKADQLPIFEVNRIKSHFDLDKSRTVVISGLLRSSESKFRQGLPFLSQIPILGRLFGSPKYQKRKTELLVFVTPRVLKPSELDKPSN